MKKFKLNFREAFSLWILPGMIFLAVFLILIFKPALLKNFFVAISLLASMTYYYWGQLKIAKDLRVAKKTLVDLEQTNQLLLETNELLDLIIRLSKDSVYYIKLDWDGDPRRRHYFISPSFYDITGIPVEKALFDMIAEILTLMGSEKEMGRVVGNAAAQKLKREGHLAHWQREARAFRLFRARLEQNLLR